jgi:hypothetical protein
MMGRQAVDQSQLFYLFNLEEHVPTDHLLRRINLIVTRVLAKRWPNASRGSATPFRRLPLIPSSRGNGSWR